MEKHIRIILFLCLSFIATTAFSQSNNWLISSDISPLSRSGNERILNNPTGLNLEWRNRVGFTVKK